MYEIKEQLHQITLYDQPETKEALDLLNKNKQKFHKYKLITGVLSLFFLICYIMIISTYIYSYTGFLMFGLPFFIFATAFVVISIIKSKLLAPYYELLRIAKRNDQIRHEERLRYRERKRLESQEVEVIYKDGQSTLIKDEIIENLHTPLAEDINITSKNLNIENQNNSHVNKKKVPPRPQK